MAERPAGTKPTGHIHLPVDLPGGALERIKRGKEKVVTRAVAHARMVPTGTGAGYTVLMNQR